MKKSWKVVLSILMLIALLLPAGMSLAQEKLDKGNTNATGYPIVDEPITLKALVKYQSLRPMMAETSVWDYIFEKTNIRVEVEYVKDADQVGLLFASREYPDFLLNIGSTASQRFDAVEAGDFVMIEDLMNQYAPTWKAFFEKHKLAYNASLEADGKLYSLPYIDFADYDRLLRDQWFINTVWLKEVGLDIPTTIDEFTAVLRAFKENAGKGSIPENVMPFFYFFDNYIGGQFDIYGSFGIPVTDANYLAVDQGKVVYQAVNPDIKEPLKYLRMLYQEGLTPPESFTDDWNMYLTKVSSDPAVTGSYGAYANRLPSMFDPMPPLDSGNGKKPLIRRQTYTPGPAHTFMIFSKNEYPVATMRLAEFIVEDMENMETVMRGKRGIFWDYTEDGKIQDLLWESDPAGMAANAQDMGLHNSFIGMRDENFYANYYNADLENPKMRAWAFENIYKNFVPEGEVNYVAGMLDSDDTAMLNQYAADINDLRKTTFANWITGKGDIDAEWDDFVKKNMDLNLEEYLALRQKAYDKLMK